LKHRKSRKIPAITPMTNFNPEVINTGLAVDLGEFIAQPPSFVDVKTTKLQLGLRKLSLYHISGTYAYKFLEIALYA
jgi:hypothetical protein